MIGITLNGQLVEMPEGGTLLQAAAKAGFAIPTLCHHPVVADSGTCRICLVEEEKSGRLITACDTHVEDGMAVLLDTERVMEARRTMLELIFSSHPFHCEVCESNNSCELKKLASQEGISGREFPFMQDYRPVVDAAGKAFLGHDIYVQPDLSEMADWFSLFGATPTDGQQPQALDMLQVQSKSGRAFIHTAHYTDRPSHADQLHVDLWHKGLNIALDPGTYRYAAEPPWENALSSTKAHNTLTINHRDQMLRAGRFLWLDPSLGP